MCSLILGWLPGLLGGQSREIPTCILTKRYVYTYSCICIYILIYILKTMSSHSYSKFQANTLGFTLVFFLFIFVASSCNSGKSDSHYL